MLKLKVPKGPETWPIIDGVSFTMQPVTPGLLEQVKAELNLLSRRALAGEPVIEGIDVDALSIPSPEDEEGAEQLRQLFFFILLAQVGVTKWEGIGDEKGEPLPCNRKNIAILMLSHAAVYGAFQQRYLRTWGELQAEGNA